MSIHKQQLTLTPERQEENASHVQGSGEHQGAAAKPWALEKIALPPGADSPLTERGASPQKPRVLSQPTKTPLQMVGRMLYPWGWGLGQERGRAAAFSGAQERLSPGQGARDTGCGHAKRHAALSQLFRTAVQPMATSRGPWSHAGRMARTSPRAPHPSTSVKLAGTLAVSTWLGLTTHPQL